MQVFRAVEQAWGTFVSLLSGEWILKGARRRANGGGVIVFRALQIAIEVYVVAVAVRSRLADGAWSFSASALRSEIRESLPWFGALFGAAYSALYARFAAQWRYLADLYNQIKTLELQALTSPQHEAVDIGLADMKAGFLEDAEELHLSTKPLFAHVICAWIEDDELVAPMFCSGAAGEEARLGLLHACASDAKATHEHRTESRLQRHRRRLGLADPHA